MRSSGLLVAGAAVVLAFSSLPLGSAAASQDAARVALRQLSSDPFSGDGAQHRTEVEPDSFGFGSTIITAFQAGRFNNGGSSGIGWARSVNGGTGWTSGVVPFLTKKTGGKTYDRASDPSVAYDARHKSWLIVSLAIVGDGSTVRDVVVSRSVDNGAHWAAPVPVAKGFFDKDWTVCDNTRTSPNYGNCYTEYDGSADPAAPSVQLHVAVSNNGGLNWSEASVPPNTPVVGGQPLVRPDGVVVMPIMSNSQQTRLESFVSSANGNAFIRRSSIAVVHHFSVGIRAAPLPSAEIDGAGKVYVVWADCRFRPNCAANDLVFSTSSNGTTWTKPKAINPSSGDTADRFIPGLAVDRTTKGATARLALAYYYYLESNCTPATCRLYVGFTRSNNSGATWSKPVQLTGPMSLGSLAETNQGRMVGDYISTSFVNHTPKPVFAFAKPPSNDVFAEAIYTTR